MLGVIVLIVLAVFVTWVALREEAFLVHVRTLAADIGDLIEGDDAPVDEPAKPTR